ncbi:hypothetical protein [Streptomyces sp. NPDC091027]|uniref:hypothetical protein n=1 Tax=Streptomyces sp. NPDC091027 TaxID=3365971 RepID=UPI0037FDA458
MNVMLGNQSRFGAEVGAEVGAPGPLRRVDLWAAGRWLTCDDNMAYVPQFRRDVLAAAAGLRSGGGSPLPFPGLSPEATHRRLVRSTEEGDASESGYELRSRFRFLLWGPTTDNVLAHLFRDEDRLLLTLSFWREDHLLGHPADAGAVFTAETGTEEFTGTLEALATALATDRRLPGRTP